MFKDLAKKRCFNIHNKSFFVDDSVHLFLEHYIILNALNIYKKNLINAKVKCSQI